MTLDDLLAREGIRDLVARYNSYSDAGRFEPLWDLFTAEAVMEVGPAGGEMQVHDGLEEVKNIFLGAKGRVDDQLKDSKPGYVRHFTATHQIDLVTPTTAKGRCYFAVVLNSGLDHWGRYVDDYRCTDGTWQFSHRRVYVDDTSANSWFAS